MSGNMKKSWYQNFCYLHMCILQIRKIQTRNTEKLISHHMTIYDTSVNSYFRVTMKLLIAQLPNDDFLKASSAKVQDIMLTLSYIS